LSERPLVDFSTPMKYQSGHPRKSLFVEEH